MEDKVFTFKTLVSLKCNLNDLVFLAIYKCLSENFHDLLILKEVILKLNIPNEIKNVKKFKLYNRMKKMPVEKESLLVSYFQHTFINYSSYLLEYAIENNFLLLYR